VSARVPLEVRGMRYRCTKCGALMTEWHQFEEWQHDECGGLVRAEVIDAPTNERCPRCERRLVTSITEARAGGISVCWTGGGNCAPPPSDACPVADCKVAYWRDVIARKAWHGKARDAADARAALGSAELLCSVNHAPEVIDAPAPQQPRGEEGCDAHLTAEDGTERRCYLAAGHSGSHDDDPRDAEIARLRADLAYQDRQQALRDAATGKVAGHAEQCGCHGCVTGPLRVENERLRAALLRYGRHEMQCRFWAEPGCTCGLAEALKETKQP
jgi:DNA-directed RNA polymerase subunit RPC12/RpoP